MKIIILDTRNRFTTEDLELLDRNGAVFYEEEGTSLDSIPAVLADEEIILAVQPSYIENGYKGLAIEKLKKFKKLRGVCLSTTAYGWAPFDELKKMGIPVTNVPGKSTDAVGEYYIFMMLALLRKLPKIIKSDWSVEYSPDLLGTDAKNLQVGIVGLGKIGEKIAGLCQAFGMNISYWNRSEKQTKYTYVSLEKLFKNSDIIFVTVAADDSTKGLITHELVDSMKKTAIFVSPVDELVFDRKYILEKVAAKEIGGLGFETHRRKVTDYRGNVFSAPEVGYFTRQTLDRESQIMTESILSIVDGKPVNVVNL